jgi:hypothetical protein
VKVMVDICVRRWILAFYPLHDSRLRDTLAKKWSILPSGKLDVNIFMMAIARDEAAQARLY